MVSLLSHPLQAFVAVAETGAVHRAAEVVGITQTGVTQRIRALEADLGTTLFTRSRKGMRLTKEGEALLHYCKGAKDLEGQLLSRVKGGSADGENELVLLVPTSILSTRVAQACLDVHAKNPKLLVHLVADDFADRVAAVKSGKADLAIVAPEQVPLEMDSKRLRPERFLLVGARAWKGRSREAILKEERIIDFYESDQTTLRYLRAFDLAPGPKKRLFINENHALIRSFIGGLGYGTLSQEVAKPYLDRGELIALNQGRALEEANALIWYPRPQMPPYLQALIKAIG